MALKRCELFPQGRHRPIELDAVEGLAERRIVVGGRPPVLVATGHPGEGLPVGCR